MNPQPTPVSDALRAQYAEYLAPERTDGRFDNRWQSGPLPGLPAVLRWKTQRNLQRPADYRV